MSVSAMRASPMPIRFQRRVCTRMKCVICRFHGSDRLKISGWVCVEEDDRSSISRISTAPYGIESFGVRLIVRRRGRSQNHIFQNGMWMTHGRARSSVNGVRNGSIFTKYSSPQSMAASRSREISVKGGRLPGASSVWAYIRG